MLLSDPERNWFRIAKASLISSTRPSLTSVSAPFSMTKRFPLPARRNLASIDKTIESRSCPPASTGGAAISLDSADFDPIGRDGYLLDNVPDKAFHLDGRRGEPSLRKLEGVA